MRAREAVRLLRAAAPVLLGALRNAASLDRALAALRADIDSIAVVELAAEVAQATVVLLARHPLRTGDSVQLASCLSLRRQVTEEVRFLGYDGRLNAAARAEGLALMVAG